MKKAVYLRVVDLLTPRRSFAYRQLEARVAELSTERDMYRDMWIAAVNTRLQNKPSVTEGKAPDRLPIREESTRRTRAEIEAELNQKDREEYDAAVREANKAGTLPNDIDFLVS
jgi:hypothetical protein